MLLASLATLLSLLAHCLTLKPHMALLSKPWDIQRRLGPFSIGSLHNMLVLWPVISWLNQEMPIIVNRFLGTSKFLSPPSSFIHDDCTYSRVILAWVRCRFLSPKKPFNLMLTDVLSYVRVPTCPSFSPISSPCTFESSHYTRPSLYHLSILQSDIITSIHRTI